MHDPLQILKQYWGYSAFRSLQRDIISSVLEGSDTVALLPTGGGKSLCFQLPAMCMDGLCLVISPLIALMKDQVDQLNKRGIRAHAIYTGLTHREIDIILDNCIYGNVKLLYVAPERLQTEIFLDRVRKMRVNLLAVDEAHCISQWGYDFRPSYLQIAAFRKENLEKVPVIALTATATEAVVTDICVQLSLNKPAVFKASFIRENLQFAVRKVEDKDRKLIQVLSNVPGTACVYVRTRKLTYELAKLLNSHGISADFYHAGLGHEQRMKKQDLWQQGSTRVMVATNAFGMGIDKADVRVVVHYDLPDSLEAYYQEAGRAGRDGKNAYAVILYHEGDKHRLYAAFELAHPSIDTLKRVYQALANYYKLAVGSSMLSYFDFDITDFCNNFNLHQGEAYHAIKRLEEEGLVELNESFYHPSKVSINIDKQDLYKFQIANATLDPLIKALLRIHGGELFTNFLVISENQLARLTNTTVFNVKSQLDHLNTLKVITYDKMRDKPQLIFTVPRQDAARLPIEVHRLNERRSQKNEKLEAILSYAETTNQCRMVMILEYFGERRSDDCGRCDYCIDKKRRISMTDHERVRDMVHFELKSGPKLPEDITHLFDHHEIPLVEDVIRQMSDARELHYDKLGRLVWKGK
jgi:ATP-dependent DNA helicase RecQ